jgi:hypothetical protein
MHYAVTVKPFRGSALTRGQKDIRPLVSAGFFFKGIKFVGF